MAPFRPQHVSMPAPSISLGAQGPSTPGGDAQPVGRVVIVGAVAFLLQVMLAPNIAIAGIAPNFLMIALIPIAMMSSQRTTVIAGFVLGLLFDLLGAGPVGGMALVLTVMGFVLWSLTSAMQIGGLTTWLVALSILAAVGNTAYCVVVSIMGYEPSFFGSLWFKVVPWTLYDIVLGAVVWPLVRRLAGMGADRQMLESRIKL